jgi:hypothetical protein
MPVFINSKLIINCNQFERQVSSKACQYVDKYHLSDQYWNARTLKLRVRTPLQAWICFGVYLSCPVCGRKLTIV